MIHTANWDDDYNYRGKRIALIGYGATGVQIMPALQPDVEKIDHYVRGRAHVPPLGGTAGEELLERGVTKNCQYDTYLC
jgi:cation diffusion facilitator CzcD-associated flavoprotein CzcO